MKKNQVTPEDIKKAYHFYAHFYYLTFGAPLEHGRKMLAKELGLTLPERLLEIGVGTGMLLKHYPAKCDITGVDICEDMLKVAQERADKLPNISIKLELMDAENLKYPNGYFDCVVLPYVLSVTPNPEKLIAEARRVCKKDGLIYILNHFSGKGFWWPLEKLVANFSGKIGFRSEFSYNQYIHNQPWQVIKVQPVNLMHLSKLVVIKNI